MASKHGPRISHLLSEGNRCERCARMRQAINLAKSGCHQPDVQCQIPPITLARPARDSFGPLTLPLRCVNIPIEPFPGWVRSTHDCFIRITPSNSLVLGPVRPALDQLDGREGLGAHLSDHIRLFCSLTFLIQQGSYIVMWPIV